MGVKIKHLVARDNIRNWVKSSLCIISAHFLGIQFVFWLKEDIWPAYSRLLFGFHKNFSMIEIQKLN